MRLCTLMCPVRGAHLSGFCQTLEHLARSCKNKDCIEIIIKMDHNEDFDYYLKLLNSSGFPAKILCYDQMQGLADSHFMHYDMAQLSESRMVWQFADDLAIDCNDLCSELSKACDVFEDNIFIYYGQQIKNNGQARLGNKFPIISKKLIDCLQWVSPHCGGDRFYRSIAQSMPERTLKNDRIKIRHLRNHPSQRNAEIFKRTFVLHSNDFIQHCISEYITPCLIPCDLSLIDSQLTRK